MIERADSDWIELLSIADPVAVSELRAILFRGIRLGLGDKADMNLVEDFTQEAVVKVLAVLGSFRGEGKFLTWALAVSMRIAFSELRKARWKDVSLDDMTSESRRALEPEVSSPDPFVNESRQTLVARLRQIIVTKLTDRQRIVIEAELAAVPQVVIAERLGINRNALYKLSHDARLKMKQGLLDVGISVEDVRSVLAEAS